MTTHGALRELAGLFLRLGVTAFGGPAAHIAMMRDEVVERRRWLTDADFLDLLAATHLIPGPNSTEMAIHLGYRRGGGPGLLVAGACFILPATLIVGGPGLDLRPLRRHPAARVGDVRRRSRHHRDRRPSPVETRDRPPSKGR